jgi:hypothetical protein
MFACGVTVSMRALDLASVGVKDIRRMKRGNEHSRNRYYFCRFTSSKNIVNGLGDCFGLFLMHAMARTGNDAELCVLRPMGQIHLKTVPGVIDLIALGFREAGEGATGSTFPSLEENHGDIVMPGEVLLWRKQTFTLKAFRIHV